MNSLGVGKSLASLGVVGKTPSSVDLGWGWRGGWVSRTFKRSRSAYRPKHPVIQVKFSSNEKYWIETFVEKIYTLGS